MTLREFYIDDLENALDAMKTAIDTASHVAYVADPSKRDPALDTIFRALFTIAEVVEIVAADCNQRARAQARDDE